jgi:zona occludens toxin
MLVFNEGVPRSGKSYDAIKDHVLPALKRGRKVFARINGLDDPDRRTKIAAYLEISTERLDELLTFVPTAKVKRLFIATKDMNAEDGEWKIDGDLKDALFVIDECHEFYVASREPIHPAIEQFFALCGQNGMDGVLMSQWYRRLHSAVRARLERKNVFQKLTAVGLQKRYQVTRYHAVAPDRYEKVGAQTLSYDPEIFPLYKGYADGAQNTEVYTGGGKTVWHKIGMLALVVVPLVGAALWVFLHFFGGDSGLAKETTGKSRLGPVPATVGTEPGKAAPPPSTEKAAPVRSAASPNSLHPTYDTKGMPPEVGYLFDMSAQARPRLAALAHMEGGKDWGVIEWREDQGHVLERLSLDQVRELGVIAEVHGYGVKLRYGPQVIVVTAWPVDMPGTSAEANQAQPVQDGRQGAYATLAAPARAQGAAASSGWKENRLSWAYTPPEQVRGPSASDWRPGN